MMLLERGGRERRKGREGKREEGKRSGVFQVKVSNFISAEEGHETLRRRGREKEPPLIAAAIRGGHSSRRFSSVMKHCFCFLCI